MRCCVAVILLLCPDRFRCRDLTVLPSSEGRATRRMLHTYLLAERRSTSTLGGPPSPN
jgi:hypothetical protein